MTTNFLFPVTSSPTVNFLEALAAAAVGFTPPFAGTAMNNLPGIPAIGSRRYLIRAIQYLCAQQVGLEFDFWNAAAGLTNVIATDGFIARYQFASANGVQFNNAGLYRYYVDGLAIPYVDLDSVNTATQPSLHVAVQNVDTVAKSANAAGAITATVWVEPMQAW